MASGTGFHITGSRHSSPPGFYSSIAVPQPPYVNPKPGNHRRGFSRHGSTDRPRKTRAAITSLKRVRFHVSVIYMRCVRYVVCHALEMHFINILFVICLAAKEREREREREREGGREGGREREREREREGGREGREG